MAHPVPTANRKRRFKGLPPVGRWLLHGAVRILAGLPVLGGAWPASAAHWEAPTVALEFRGIHDSELFPGSQLSTPDVGAQFEGNAASARRLSKSMKLDVDLRAGGQLWSRFSEASYGWGGAMGTVRRGRTQLRAEAEWAPHRLKFPAAVDGGVFERLETRLGVRQSITDRLRLRVEGRHQDDDFVSAYDVRDAKTNEGYVQLVFKADARVTFRADALIGRTRTQASRYSHADHVVGAAAEATLARWRVDAGVRSGHSRYRDAVVGDSNYRRRDEWLQLRAEVRRELSGHLSVLVADEWIHQQSSRPDRTYSRNGIHFGLAWTAGE